jgi:hypothetical protein
MNDEELLSAVRTQLAQCAGYGTNRSTEDDKTALDYYFQRSRDVVAGRSAVVAGGFSAMVEAVLAQMSDAFSSDSLVDFCARSADDEEQAQAESDFVTYKVMAENAGIIQIQSAIKDALQLRNGIVKVWVEEKRNRQTFNYTDVAPEALAELIQPRPGVEIKPTYDEDAQKLTLQVTQVTKIFRTKAIPKENFFYFADHDSPDLSEIGFCGERHVETRSELIQRGYSAKQVNALPQYKGTTNPAALARAPGSEQALRVGIDTSQESVEWLECYALMSGTDNTSVLHRLAVDSALTELLADDEVKRVPYAGFWVFINPHRFTGISLFDKLKQNDDITTALERALLDNVNTVTKNRIAYSDGKVNVDDLSNGRPDGSIRVNRSVEDVRSAIMAFNVPDLGQSILANLQHQNSLRTEMGGAALELASGNAQIGGDRMGSQGLDRAYSVMEQLSAHMLKNAANTGIRSTFLLAHATLREDFSQPIALKMRGVYVTQDPTQWPERTELYVKPGMSPGERARRVVTLTQVLDRQAALAQGSMEDILVSASGYYAALLDWLRVSDMPNPERYWLDPRSDGSVKKMNDNAQASAMQQNAQHELMRQAVELQKISSALQKYQTDVETQFKYYNANLSAQVEEAKIVGGAAVKMLTPPPATQPDEMNGDEPKSDNQDG